MAPARMAALVAIVACAVTMAPGCSSTKTSNTARTATEQLLVSNAVDQSLNRIDFQPFAGRRVFIDEKYTDCVDKAYVLGSVRHRVLRHGGELAAKPEEADVIVEVRSGVVGTNISDSYLGTPELTLPGMLTIPGIKLVNRESQEGIAKIGLVAYDAKTHAVLGDGGVSMAKSDNNNWYVFGAGPYQNGTIRSELDNSLHQRPGEAQSPLPTTVVFATPRAADPEPSTQLASPDDAGRGPATPVSGVKP